MNCFTKPINALYFFSVDELSAEIWHQINLYKNSYFSKDFLQALEKNHPEIDFYYLVLLDEKKRLKAFAILKIVTVYLDDVTNNFDSFLQKTKKVVRRIGMLPHKKPLQLLVCGNTFVSGEHGILIATHQDKKTIFQEIGKSILTLQSQKSLIIDAILLKDFKDRSLFMTDELKSFRYHPFSVEPNMVLHIDENWMSFEDYLAAMKTKFRVKAKKAYQLSSSIKIEDVTSKNIDVMLPKITALYQKVAAKATFNLGDFNVATYKDFKHFFGENYILKTYSIDDKIVGFISGIIHQNTLDAHFVGIDYQLNKSHAIYQRMLYNYIEIAIQHNLKTLNFGRTASEIKSSVGAEPQNLTIYLKHKKSITNKILKLFLQHVQPTPFQQKFPFKTIIPNEKLQ